MKREVFLAIAALVLAGAAHAAEVMEFPASKGKVIFPHKKHQEMLRDCTKCHEKGPGKIADLGQKWAHKTCRGCHQELGRGPTACTGCHHKD
ncbi:cytochrome c family protein [Geomonas sp. Red32]|uniref:cytochrome c7 n=1 Tax=Geomonas sp. Red32 TaxID=2912856 RepID=UPI00202CE62F|nr:cytochrome c7 [Geomonas sp. Red32]MCM0080729.1 cytochrome c family protein [Geomonas sp. Red32]